MSASSVDSAAAGGRLGAINIDGRTGGEEWMSCQKDASNDIYCYRANSTPAWTTPSNNILTATSDTGIQRSFYVAYEAQDGVEGVAVYSTNNAVPKYRLYSVAGNSFGAETNLVAGIGAALETVRLRPHPDNNDIMVLMGDTLQDLYTVVWDGQANGVYTNPVGYAQTGHGVNGSDDLDFWFDFAWDLF